MRWGAVERVQSQVNRKQSLAYLTQLLVEVGGFQPLASNTVSRRTANARANPGLTSISAVITVARPLTVSSTAPLPHRGETEVDHIEAWTHEIANMRCEGERHTTNKPRMPQEVAVTRF